MTLAACMAQLLWVCGDQPPHLPGTKEFGAQTVPWPQEGEQSLGRNAGSPGAVPGALWAQQACGLQGLRGWIGKPGTHASAGFGRHGFGRAGRSLVLQLSCRDLNYAQFLPP